MISPKKNLLLILLILALVTACGPGRNQDAEEHLQMEDPGDVSDSGFPPLISRELLLATTTSLENSGLLDFILPDLHNRYGINVKVVAVGSGAALQMGIDGEADVLLAHARDQELALVETGVTLERFDVMYNDFVIIGPMDDPAGLLATTPADVGSGLRRIFEHEAVFVSRGDDSGTHIMELNLWRESGVEEPAGSWYISAGQGMGDVILMADEMEGYTLTDRGTYLAMQDNVELMIVVEGDPRLKNQYGVMAVNPENSGHINYPAAARFVDWILSPETQDLISRFGMEEHGESLFFPNAE
jgi:tungstate transport system substrate-binding protein